MSSLRRLGIIALSFVVFWADKVCACSCGGPIPPLKEMAGASAVFTCKVVKITKVGIEPTLPDFFTGYDVSVQLMKVIKGKALKLKIGGTITIHTGTGGGDCGYTFDEGEAYLIYAFGKALKLSTNICTRTQPLDGADNEILELERKLPKIQHPPHPPELVLTGKIDDSGYHGYVFELRNYLHDRIFHAGLQAQIFRDGKWESYPANYGVGPRSEPSALESAQLLAEQTAQVVSLEAIDRRQWPRGVRFLDRVRADRVFAAVQSNTYPWRIGFQYLAESSYDAGKKLSNSRHWVWGPRMEGSTSTTNLTFDQAFQGSGMLPNPLSKDEAFPEAGKR